MRGAITLSSLRKKSSPEQRWSHPSLAYLTLRRTDAKSITCCNGRLVCGGNGWWRAPWHHHSHEKSRNSLSDQGRLDKAVSLRQKVLGKRQKKTVVFSKEDGSSGKRSQGRYGTNEMLHGRPPVESKYFSRFRCRCFHYKFDIWLYSSPLTLHIQVQQYQYGGLSTLEGRCWLQGS